MKVTITATGTAGTISVSSATTPAIASEPIAPEDVLAPSIEGSATAREALTAKPGSWLSTEAISYTYQWQRCTEEGDECTDIEGAAGESYGLSEEDIGSTLRVVVTANNSLGSANATSSQSEVVTASGPPANTDRPVVYGTAKEGERLVAGNGSWSGSSPLSFYYSWERCNGEGGSCAVIEGEDKPNYTVVGSDIGSTLRVKVTATNSLGSAGAVSSQAIVTASGEASVAPALEVIEETDPSVLAPATSATLEEQEVKPALSDSEEELSATTALASSSISKETPGEFAVNTPDGELSFAPIGSLPNATATPTIVNGSAAVFSGTWRATDTIIRPDALGATTLLQLRSSEAPTSFSWEIGLSPNEQLEQLSDGSVAVVETQPDPSLEESLGEALGSPEPSEASAEPGEEPGASGEVAEDELEEELSEESPLEKLPAAPETSTPEITPKSGELHPQETTVQYANDTSSLASAEEQTGGATLMVIQAPTVMDSKGNSVSASLSNRRRHAYDDRLT